ncbi:hypothetical protein CGLO_08248 [Colletotrichum gloeosporioides Cg-14]|uniref:Uncharacterized protein n=1 Tax=Colletotrichum gloeosporioides (strain Cg-14) TaxID=1237896 RepID=T0KGT5_COLGC|nr:hypothetical protein CGLO_08248 [Colletotrichum gloeosporioides Cg-14]
MLHLFATVSNLR